MAAARMGFIPVGTPDTRYVRRVPVAAVAKEVAKGDACISLAGLIAAASGATNPTKFGYGVVLAVYTTAGRPLTFNTTKYIASGGVGMADVCWDPNQIYYVQCVTSVGTSNIGSNVMIDVSAANALTGLSGQSVDFPASASTGEYFKVIGIGPFDNKLLAPYGQTIGGGGANNGVTVAWNNHFLRTPTAGQ